MARVTIPKLEASTFKSWAFVLVAGTALALLAVAHRGGVTDAAATGSSAGCELEVVADRLNIRDGPSRTATLVETLERGVRVEGTRVVTDGFRELERGRWAADQYLTPLPGTNCA